MAKYPKFFAYRSSGVLISTGTVRSLDRRRFQGEPWAQRLVIPAWKARARQLKVEVYALYYASRDPRVPWYAKALAGCIVAYAFSPIDLIPDVIPVLGYLDDLVLIPLGVLAVRRLIPVPILDDCRARASTLVAEGQPTSWTAAAAIVVIWVGAMIVVGQWIIGLLTP